MEPPDPQSALRGDWKRRALSAGDPRTVAAEFAARIACRSRTALAAGGPLPYPAGREQPEEDSALRNPFQRDRDRIVHGKAFRRLTHKTQVFVAPRGDHSRTRLTHTLEVTDDLADRGPGAGR